MTSTVPLSSESMESQRGPFEVVRDGDLAMTTWDGVILRADVYRPEAPGPRPVLVRRTPYGKRSNDLAADFSEVHYFASHGYLVVVQDTRGRFTSEGVWYPFIYEGRDGYDTIDWAATLPGSSGAVGTLGQSYGAIVQYLAATQRPPRLRTCIPVSAYQLTFENCWYNAGALELGWLLSYFVNMAEDVLAADGDRASIAELAKLKVDPTVRFSALTEDALRHLPLRDWIDRLGRGAPFLADILWHWTDGPYWWATDLSRQLFNINVPMLHIGSWYDIANRDTPLYFTGLRSSALDARDRHALIMGPWAHQLPFNQPTSGGTGDIDFGPEAAISLVDIERRWFDHYLKAEGADLPCSPVRIFVMGENRWRDEQQWPLARADYTSFYLHSGGSANTVNGDGILSVEAPGDEPADRYRHEPDNPVPTRAAGSLAAVWLIRHDPAAAVRAFLSPTMSDADLKRLTARNRASLDQAVWDRYLLNWVGPAFVDDLRSYAGRVTLLAGEHDPFVTQAALAAIDDALPNSRAGAIMNAGHYPSIEAPQATCDAVEEALRLRDAQTLSR